MEEVEEIGIGDVEDMGIDIGKITELHHATFELDTPIGKIVLKPLAEVTFQEIMLETMATYPEYMGIVKRMSYLEDKSKYPDGLTAAEQVERVRLYRRASGWARFFEIECFVEPKLETVEQLEALSSEIGAEWVEVQAYLNVLCDPMPAGEMHIKLAEVALKYGVDLASDLTAENITVQQAGALRAADERKARAIWEEIDAAGC
jgi:hypothetical protein